ncbi:Cof-type HAD-IIB family hydrolase [Chlamydia psittaci]|uniref:HAD family phosphatase n=1 Tax=Chlamydophila parapsittaci TaxID=344886 RepID=A0ABX5VZZ4_9CHLA|nr:MULTISPECIES: HAD family hydrolase [Chlamydia]AFS20511.1 HAD-superhydrolase, subIIB family protein [Chlamydia psittaci GR9]AFS23713.1 HAD-superhydrolase, subIIB family protein [Chlamydia psittaci WS/RT/E30]QDE37565.1 HAD family phosphatase [Chlamydophila parapsittaci]QHE19225.1 HAD-IIB family hydrolase [Chlamydia psittaci]UOB76063.1 Cof-type HAD-IIB family hydrolase [Chlamydia psittaci]
MDKLLITDIDGTITHLPRHLDPKIIQYLIHLYHSGWTLFFLTGRYFSYANHLFKDFPVPYLLGCQNGACVWSSVENQFLYFQNIPHEILPELEMCIEDSDVICSIESGALYQDHCYRHAYCPSAEDLLRHLNPVYFPNTKDRERLVETKKLSQDYPNATFAVAKIFGKKNEVDKVRERIIQSKELVNNLTITFMRWPFDFDYAILFMTDKSVSKGCAVDRVVDIVYEGQKPFIIASGDDANDIDLIERGDFKIVMSSAPQPMHSIADFLASPAKELGILSAWEAGVAQYHRIKNA